jgi:NAD(P)-dependent dehydrogenase (short-subunit alcohol dehydrogenase family)
VQDALHSASKVRPGGTLLFMGGTGGRRNAPGFTLISALTAALPALTRNLALELAPIRVNLIAAGFVDTPLSAALLGDQLEARREQLRTTLPIRRVVGPADVAALAVHLMISTAVTGATYDIDGGQLDATTSHERRRLEAARANADPGSSHSLRARLVLRISTTLTILTPTGRNANPALRSLDWRSST